MSETLNILELKNVKKTFLGGSIIANENVSFNVKTGTIHSIVGENGAGKSTIMSIVFGLYDRDEGEIFYKNEEFNISSPTEANGLGIGMVHQHFKLVDDFTVLENILLGQEFSKYGVLDMKQAKERFTKLSDDLNFKIKYNKKIKFLTVGEKQKVEIMKVMWSHKDLIIFDEPTATLSVNEIKEFMNFINTLKSQGKTMIFISHKLKEVKQVSDFITVMRRGKVIVSKDAIELTIEQISGLMVGENIKLEFDSERKILDEIYLKLENISYTNKDKIKVLDSVSFFVKRGEVFGIAGIQDNGQTELLEILGGLTIPSEGNIFLNKISDNLFYKTKISQNIWLSDDFEEYKNNIIKEMEIFVEEIFYNLKKEKKMGKIFNFTFHQYSKDTLELSHKEKSEIEIKKNKFLIQFSNFPNSVDDFKSQIKKNVEEKMTKFEFKKIEVVISDLWINLVDFTIRERQGLMNHIPEDRHRYGLVSNWNIASNASFNNLNDEKFAKKRIKKLGKEEKNVTISRKREIEFAKQIVEKHNIQGVVSVNQTASGLSGGNQQKFVVGREIENKHDIIVAGHPTRGLDIKAIKHIYSTLIQEAEQNQKTIILSSLELDELIAACDRVAVIYDGKIQGIINPKNYTYKQIGKLMVGEKIEGIVV